MGNFFFLGSVAIESKAQDSQDAESIIGYQPEKHQINKAPDLPYESGLGGLETQEGELQQNP